MTPASASPRAPTPRPGPPLGSTVRLGRSVWRPAGGRTLVGGSPTRVMVLSRDGASRLVRRRLRVTDESSRRLAGRLVETGVGFAEPAPAMSADPSRLTVVIPVRDRVAGLRRLLGSIPRGHRVLVVDDASADAEAIRRAAADAGASVERLEVNVGPAGARNAGLRLVETPLVAFVDSDVVLGPHTLQTLSAALADAGAAAAAPRIAALGSASPPWHLRYEDARSSLDLGPEPAIVRPRSRVAWVPSACLVARVDALGDGFDADLRVAEDVDLVWRLAAAGWAVHYVPDAVAHHEHREAARDWLARKAYYGTGAALLADRHGDAVAPAVFAPWSAVVAGAVLVQRRWAWALAAAATGVAMARISRAASAADRPAVIGVRLGAQGVADTLGQTSALLLRHWWPAVAVAAIGSARVRRAVVVAAVADCAVEYAKARPALDPVRFGLARRLDDLAYGAGVWAGAARRRSGRALLPALSRGRARPRR